MVWYGVRPVSRRDAHNLQNQRRSEKGYTTQYKRCADRPTYNTSIRSDSSGPYRPPKTEIDQIDHRLVSFHFIRRAGVSRVHCAVLCIVTIKVPRAVQDRCRLSLPCLVTHCRCAKSLHNNQSNSGKSSRILVTRAVHALSTASHRGSPRDGPRTGQVKSSRSWALIRVMLCYVMYNCRSSTYLHHITSHHA